jgi:hypothetical protein
VYVCRVLLQACRLQSELLAPMGCGSIRAHCVFKHVRHRQTCWRPWVTEVSVCAVASPALRPRDPAASMYVVASSMSFIGIWWPQVSCVVGSVCSHGAQQHPCTLLLQQSALLAPTWSGSIRAHCSIKHVLHGRTCSRPWGAAASMTLWLRRGLEGVICRRGFHVGC